MLLGNLMSERDGLRETLPRSKKQRVVFLCIAMWVHMYSSFASWDPLVDVPVGSPGCVSWLDSRH